MSTRFIFTKVLKFLLQIKYQTYAKISKQQDKKIARFHNENSKLICIMDMLDYSPSPHI